MPIDLIPAGAMPVLIAALWTRFGLGAWAQPALFMPSLAFGASWWELCRLHHEH